MNERDMKCIADQLSDFYTPDEARQFVFAPNPILGGCSPDELIRQGAVDEVLLLVNQLRDGVYL